MLKAIYRTHLCIRRGLVQSIPQDDAIFARRRGLRRVREQATFFALAIDGAFPGAENSVLDGRHMCVFFFFASWLENLGLFLAQLLMKSHRLLSRAFFLLFLLGGTKPDQTNTNQTKQLWPLLGLLREERI
jgi:hypothetical protein